MEKEINFINNRLGNIRKQVNALINRKHKIEGKFNKGDEKDRFLGDYITSFNTRKDIVRIYKEEDISKLKILVKAQLKDIEKVLKKIEKEAETKNIKIKVELNAIKHRIKEINELISFRGSNKYPEEDILGCWLDIDYNLTQMRVFYLKQIDKKFKKRKK